MPSAREREDSATEMKTALLSYVVRQGDMCAAAEREAGAEKVTQASPSERLKQGKGATVR